VSPAPARLSHPGGADCAAHEVRIDSLDDQCASLRRKAEATHDDVGSLRTELALLRQAVLQQTAAIGELRADLAASALRRETDLKAEIEKRSMPTRGQVQTVVLAAFLALALGWVGANVLPKLPSAQQAPSVHTH
jgi:hypothetical protein